MEALDLLLNRASNPHLIEPAPAGESLRRICRAALRAPDHAGLQPWRHLIVVGEGLQRLSEILVAAAQRQVDQGSLDPAKLERAARLPFRAPMIIITIARLEPHPKVPEVEQLLSAGCAIHAMQQAAFAQGFGGMWRTGSYAYDPTVQQQLQLADNERIVGFLYLGTPKKTPAKRRQPLDPDHFFSYL